MTMRINKYIASSGLCSRRKAENFVLEGRVTINGETVRELSRTVEDGDLVMLDGKPVTPISETYVYLYNKPAGKMCSRSDPHCPHTIYEDLPEGEGLFSVGRLDVDTEGLLLVTNDGKLANRLAHPSYEVEKEYLARIDSPLDEQEKSRIRSGISYEGIRYSPAAVFEDHGEAAEGLSLEKGGPRPGEHWVRLIIHEGKKREVRRILQACGKQVLRLIRIRYGALVLGGEKPGAYRKLSREEERCLE